MKNNSGYTLVEAVIVLAIISFGLVSILGLFNKSLLRYDEAQKITEATIIASNQIQSTLAQRNTSNVPSVPSEPTAVDGFALAKSWEPTNITGVTELKITVSWGNATSESVILSAFVPEVK